MKFNQLKYFAKVVELKNISAAARNLNIAQPSLTNTIHLLESNLGVRLLERTAKGVIPTVAGKRLYEHAIIIMRQIQYAQDDIKSLTGKPHGEVSITVPGTMSRHLTPKLMRTVSERFPDISLKIIDVLSSQALELVETGGVDFGIIPNASELPSAKSIPLYQENLYVLGAPGYFDRRRRTINFSEISKLPLVLTARKNDVRTRLEQVAITTGTALNIRFEQRSVETLKSIVLEGLACSVLSCYMFDQEILTGKLSALRITSPDLNRVLTASWNHTRPLTIAAETILGLVVEIIDELDKKGILKGKILTSLSDLVICSAARASSA